MWYANHLRSQLDLATELQARPSFIDESRMYWLRLGVSCFLGVEEARGDCVRAGGGVGSQNLWFGSCFIGV